MLITSQDRGTLADSAGKVFTCETSKYVKEEYAIYMPAEYGTGTVKMGAYKSYEDCLIVLAILKHHGIYNKNDKEQEPYFDFPSLLQLKIIKEHVLENYELFEDDFLNDLREVWEDLDMKIRKGKECLK